MYSTDAVDAMIITNKRLRIGPHSFQDRINILKLTEILNK